MRCFEGKGLVGLTSYASHECYDFSDYSYCLIILVETLKHFPRYFGGQLHSHNLL